MGKGFVGCFHGVRCPVLLPSFGPFPLSLCRGRPSYTIDVEVDHQHELDVGKVELALATIHVCPCWSEADIPNLGAAG